MLGTRYATAPMLFDVSVCGEMLTTSEPPAMVRLAPFCTCVTAPTTI